MRSIDEANKCRLGRETSRGDINTNEGGGGRGNTTLYCLLSHSGNLQNNTNLLKKKTTLSLEKKTTGLEK